LRFFTEERKKNLYIQKKVNFMSFFKFLRNLFGGSTETTVESTPTKVEEPVVEKVVVTKAEPVPTKVVEPVAKKTEESVKTAKEIKAKVKRPANNQKPNNPGNTSSKPRPKRKRPAPKKPTQGE
jgi:hypothetical protein